MPAWPGLLLLGGVVLASSRLLLGRDVSRWLLLPAVLAAQVALHTSFGALGAAGHAAHGAGSGTASPWSGRMLVAHASVTLLTLLVWRLCERAAVAVVRLLALPTTVVVGRARAPADDSGGDAVAGAPCCSARPAAGHRWRPAAPDLRPTGEAWHAPTHPVTQEEPACPVTPSPARSPGPAPRSPPSPPPPSSRRPRRPRLRHPVGDRRRLVHRAHPQRPARLRGLAHHQDRDPGAGVGALGDTDPQPLLRRRGQHRAARRAALRRSRQRGHRAHRQHRLHRERPAAGGSARHLRADLPGAGRGG